MKTAISMPDDLFKDIDKLSKKLNCSRSHLLTNAAREYIEKLKNKNITKLLTKHIQKRKRKRKQLLEKNIKSIMLKCSRRRNGNQTGRYILG